MDRLVRKGMAVLLNECIHGEDYTMPYNGYSITETIRIKSGEDIENPLLVTEILKARAMYQRAKAEHDKILKNVFEI
jgi:hypothetical protein